jgi:hypothetical protein
MLFVNQRPVAGTEGLGRGPGDYDDPVWSEAPRIGARSEKGAGRPRKANCSGLNDRKEPTETRPSRGPRMERCLRQYRASLCLRQYRASLAVPEISISGLMLDPDQHRSEAGSPRRINSQS